MAEDHIAPLGLDMDAYKNFDLKDGGQAPLAEHAYQMFFRAAFLEEGIKFALLIFLRKIIRLNEPMDAIVYSAYWPGYAA